MDRTTRGHTGAESGDPTARPVPTPPGMLRVRRAEHPQHPQHPQHLQRPEHPAASLPPVDSFAALGLPPELLAVLAANGITDPSPVQGATLPDALAGRDVLGRGRTGSGKTLAFGLALLARTAGRRAQPQRPLALVLLPTRELAQQVTAALAPYAQALGLRLATVVGGLSVSRQARTLRGGVEVLVATPGRLADLVERGACALDRVAATVLDEADQMTGLGFAPQITALLDRTAPTGQRMLFSATLDHDVDLLVERYLTDPAVHAVEPPAEASAALTHHLLLLERGDKDAVTLRIAEREPRVLMFLDTRHAVDDLTDRLLLGGVRAAALHGGKSQPQRTRTLTRFRSGEVTVLVATDVAARGIHVEGLDLVVNVDPPTDRKDYLHRGGRTARAGRPGTVVTLVLPHQRAVLERLLAESGITAQVTDVGAGEAVPSGLTGAPDRYALPLPLPAAPPAPPVATPRAPDSAAA